MTVSMVSESSSASTESSSSSVIEKVISDVKLLKLILTCLPVRSLLVVKSVSKTWYSVIGDRDFAVAQLRRYKPTGLFLERKAATPIFKAGDDGRS